MNMLSVEPFCEFTICSCAWKKLCLTTNKIVFDNKKIELSKNCVWRQTKLYLTTRKLNCQKNLFDEKNKIKLKTSKFVLSKNCVWWQAKLYLTTNKLCLMTRKIVFDNKNNCVWRQAKLYLTTKKLCLTTSKIVFDNKQIVLLSRVPHPQRSVELKTAPMNFGGGGCQSVHGLHILS
jgi:hypothetical protein